MSDDTDDHIKTRLAQLAEVTHTTWSYDVEDKSFKTEFPKEVYDSHVAILGRLTHDTPISLVASEDGSPDKAAFVVKDVNLTDAAMTDLDTHKIGFQRALGTRDIPAPQQGAAKGADLKAALADLNTTLETNHEPKLSEKEVAGIVAMGAANPDWAEKESHRIRDTIAMKNGKSDEKLGSVPEPFLKTFREAETKAAGDLMADLHAVGGMDAVTQKPPTKKNEDFDNVNGVLKTTLAAKKDFGGTITPEAQAKASVDLKTVILGGKVDAPKTEPDHTQAQTGFGAPGNPFDKPHPAADPNRAQQPSKFSAGFHPEQHAGSFPPPQDNGHTVQKIDLHKSTHDTDGKYTVNPEQSKPHPGLKEPGGLPPAMPGVDQPPAQQQPAPDTHGQRNFAHPGDQKAPQMASPLGHNPNAHPAASTALDNQKIAALKKLLAPELGALNADASFAKNGNDYIVKTDATHTAQAVKKLESLGLKPNVDFKVNEAQNGIIDITHPEKLPDPKGDVDAYKKMSEHHKVAMSNPLHAAMHKALGQGSLNTHMFAYDAQFKNPNGVPAEGKQHLGVGPSQDKSNSIV